VSSPSRPRLLLVELLSTDRFSQYRSEAYPFFLAFARFTGIEARHVGLGFDPEAQPNNRFVVLLPDEDVAGLVHIIREHRASHVFLNERLEPVSEAAVKRGAPDTEIRYMDYRDLQSIWPSGAQFLQSLGMLPGPDADDLLIDLVDPVYDRELVNSTARQIRPMVKLYCGPICVYRRPVSQSPAFAGVDLPGLDRPWGCSFCAGGAADIRHPSRHSPVELAMLQIRSLERADPDRRPPREYEVEGIALFEDFGRFFQSLLEDGVPPSKFYFSCRIDDVLRKAGEVEEWLPKISAAGHQVRFSNMGVENFSPVENDRFNKNITFDQAARVDALLTRWEQDWPDTVFFHAHNGYSFILFTPWTTLDDLEHNARALRRLPNLDWTFSLATRLQLLADRPISRLAEHDGLTADAFDDPLMSRFCPAGCITEADQQEIPWRFADARTALVHRIMLRRYPEVRARGFDDPDLEQLNTLVQRLPAACRDCNLTLFEALLEVLRGHPGLETVPQVMERLLESIPADQLDDGSPAPEPAPVSGERRPFFHRVEKAMQSLAGHTAARMVGFEVREVSATPDGAVQVALAHGEEELLLRVVPNPETQKAYVRTSDLAVSYLPETPLDSEWKRRALEMVARALELFP
jgi:hypothetical protein